MTWKRVARQGLKPTGYARLAAVLNEIEATKQTPEMQWLANSLRKIIDKDIEPLRALDLKQSGRPRQSMKEFREKFLRDHAAILAFIAERIEAGDRPAIAKRNAADKFSDVNGKPDLRAVQKLWKEHGALTLVLRKNSRSLKAAPK